MTPGQMRDARYALGLNQGEMSDALAISRRQLSKFESDTDETCIPERVADVVNLLAYGEWPDRWPSDLPWSADDMRQAVEQLRVEDL